MAYERTETPIALTSTTTFSTTTTFTTTTALRTTRRTTRSTTRGWGSMTTKRGWGSMTTKRGWGSMTTKRGWWSKLKEKKRKCLQNDKFLNTRLDCLFPGLFGKSKSPIKFGLFG